MSKTTRALFCAVFVVGCLQATGGVAQETPFAQLRADYDAHTPVPGESSIGLIPDTIGDGAWNFFGSITENPTDPGAELWPLSYSTTGPHAVVDGNAYIYPDQDYGLPGIKNGQLILGANEGVPDDDELAVHSGQAGRTHMVTRWTAGESAVGDVKLAGTMRELGIVVDGVTFSVFADGVRHLGPAHINTEEGLDFDVDVTVASGSSVDFVVGKNGNFFSDHSALSVDITPTVIIPPSPRVVLADLRADYDAHTPVPGEPSLGLIVDTHGHGEWNFFDSATANPTDADADLTPLSYSNTQPHAVVAADSYVDPDQGPYFLAGIKNGQLILGANEGFPNADEVGVHPGQSGRTYMVTRWTAGEGEDGEINVSGAARELGVVCNGITFAIYADGDLAFDGGALTGPSAVDFDFDANVTVGSSIDFVVGNNGNFACDHSALSVAITRPELITGDFNNDGVLDVDDLDLLGNEIIAGTDNPDFDVTGDGVVDLGDQETWLDEAASANGFTAPYLNGDTNLDGTVNAQDLNALALSWQQVIGAWSGGDFNADNIVNAADLNLLALNWQQSTPMGAQAVPEPAVLLLLWPFLAAGFMLRTAKHRGI
jgi:hypothetical protein